MAASNEFIWTPTREFVRNSNLMQFMNHTNIASFEELREKSVRNPEWFWDAVNKFLRLEWYVPYSEVKDQSRGIMWAKWFLGGKINIAHNCIDRFGGILDSKPAVICESEDRNNRRIVTYKELSDMTNRIANALCGQMHLQKGDKVGLFMPMSAEAVAAFFAMLKIGAIVVPIFSGYGKEAISTRLNDCDAKAIVTQTSFSRRGKEIPLLATALKAAKLIPSIKSILVSDHVKAREISPEGPLLFDWGSVSSEPTEFNTETMDSEDPFMIIYTSGTTGKPKGAVHVHGGFLVKVAEEMAFQMDLKPDDVLFWFTDMGWIMAPWEMIGALALGGTILVYSGAPDYPTPARLWEVVEDDRVTKMGLSPTLIRALMKYGDKCIKEHDLSSLKAFGSTGEPWDPESYDWLFRTVGKGVCPIINLSGGTEVGACFLSVHPVLPIKACSLGGPCLGLDVDVVDESGKPLRQQTGELVVRSPWPSMTRGLWKDPARYSEAYWSKIPDMWVHGDWASIDADGYWYLHGRSDDTIKVAGKRVGPGEIESALATHESVLESVAIGLPDRLKGEKIACFVMLRPGYRPTDALRSSISHHVAASLGESLRPSEISFVAALPRTRNAKLVRRLVKSKLLGLPLGDTSNIENIDSLEAIANAC